MWLWMLSALALVVGVGVWRLLRHPAVGASPSRKQRAAHQASPHWRDGQFQNLSPTPQLAEGETTLGTLWYFLTTRTPHRTPSAPLPVDVPNLNALPRERNVLVWLGHSSYYLQVEGLRLAVDPVLSREASPVPGTNRAFAGPDRFQPTDLPDLDLLLLTHDHYDHLDYPTIRALQPRVQRVVTALGVGAHLARWGYRAHQLTELDWGQHLEPAPGWVLHCTPARHFSGRGLQRNTTLWCSFVLQTPQRRLYLGGDSGYDTHFAAIGRQFGPFDLAILEAGQYDAKWPYIHLLPEQFQPAAQALQARAVLPVHHSKFALAAHPWDAPLRALTAAAPATNPPAVPLLTPRIGQVVDLDAVPSTWSRWWEPVNPPAGT